MTTTYTETFRFAKPDFRSPDWAPALQRNFDGIDTALRNLLMDVVPWENDTEYEIGHVVIDTVANPVAYWICSVTHTTETSPATFAEERTDHPTYWTAFSFGIQARGAWANDTVYAVNDIAYDSVRGITGIVHTAHTSNEEDSIQEDSAYWNFIVNLPTVFTALATYYDPTTSGLSATNVQAAIDELEAFIADAYVSSNVTYDNGVSGMTATNVKAALDELRALATVQAASIAANETAISTGLISTGFMQWRPTAEALPGWVPANALTIGKSGSAATSRANDDTEDLFAWHWNNFSNTECPVSTGRGANAAADFAASKTMTVLDMKGISIVGVDTMNGAATTRLSGVPVVSGGATTPGSIVGANLHTLTVDELAAHYHEASISDPTHVHATLFAASRTTGAIINGGASLSFWTGETTTNGNAASTGVQVTSDHGLGTTYSEGGDDPHNNVARSRTGYWYIKL